ncbi:TetR/AcrR family transcriptional regulator [Bacteroidota bacterium]
MSPRTQEQFEEIRENKRQLIKNTALELFANEGYFQTSISKIAKKAGISKGLMYNYFESKEDLIKEILHDGVDTIYKNFDPNSDGILTKDEFIFYIKETVKVLKEQIDFWKLFYAFTLQPGVMELLEKETHSISPKMMQTLVGYFQNKYGDKFEEEILVFLSLMKGASMTYVFAPEVFSIDILEKKIIEMYT